MSKPTIADATRLSAFAVRRLEASRHECWQPGSISRLPTYEETRQGANNALMAMLAGSQLAAQSLPSWDRAATNAPTTSACFRHAKVP